MSESPRKMSHNEAPREVNYFNGLITETEALEEHFDIGDE